MTCKMYARLSISVDQINASSSVDKLSYNFMLSCYCSQMQRGLSDIVINIKVFGSWKYINNLMDGLFIAVNDCQM